MMQEGYVIPACEVIDDIRRSTKAGELRVPTMNDTLCLASRYGNVDLVKSLLAAGAVVNVRPGSTESSAALVEAAEHEQLEVMELLLSMGARFGEEDGKKYRPIALLTADRSKHTNIQPWSSRSVPNIIPPFKEQAHTHGPGVRSIKSYKTEESRLTAEAHKKSQKSTGVQLEKWIQQPERHEKIAMGYTPSRSFADTILVMDKLGWRSETTSDTKRTGLALPSNVNSHRKRTLYQSSPSIAEAPV